MSKARTAAQTKGKQFAQAAALPFRLPKNSKPKVLLVTSRDTGRWVPPKGWLIKGKKPWSTAKIEAREEAGAIGAISKTPLGTYDYQKLLEDGTTVDCRVTLYPMFVRKLHKQWDEKHERKRRWFSPKRAARRVDEPELSQMILMLYKPDDWICEMVQKQGRS
ncbi:NUDIX hydrolase (plasmid) [Ruegeria sp. SCSIO 43209]|uniref:NUDIX hydrolase n=1 Tax=Ruegeria sp. SCSIO 43209 TaxID=2793010 RepID=UPI00147EAA54|nr:NUDIX hydrolase [Ruegeria sp. SCSIO 43209]UAB91116.1 NUDIX hydrolase [Ruegeria sp. SCSIO 43209]